ncbi:unnamed protein product, partial [Mesorhabditis spiculigera]
MMQEASDGDFSENEFKAAFSSPRFDRARLISTETNDDPFYEAEWQSASVQDEGRLMELEEEQERLNNSLFSLSSQFAQVQFRLKQITEAGPEDKERLLKELHEFAFRGCADLSELKRMRSESVDDEEIRTKQKERQRQLVNQLREQIEDLEKMDYESGEGQIPSNMVIQKQKAVLQRLQEKINLNLHVDSMSESDLMKQVEDAIKELVNPFKEKEQLMEQLQTQIVDLERFVNYLQREAAQPDSPTKAIGSSNPPNDKKKSQGSGLTSWIGWSSKKFQKNQLKATPKGNHYGDERARLQLAVDATQEVLRKYTLLDFDNDSGVSSSCGRTSTDTLCDEVFVKSEEEVTTVVRKQLCPALRALLEHGLLDEAAKGPSFSAGIGCINARAHPGVSNKTKPLHHIWDVILFFYDLKNGRDAADAPVRHLSQSFALENVAGRTVTSKQALIGAIESIINSHARLRRSYDAQWKAFVSAALNERRLPAWLRIIFRTRQVVDYCFHPWSYVARTGCEELYTLLESLHPYNVTLPVDLAVRPFTQIKEAF